MDYLKHKQNLIAAVLLLATLAVVGGYARAATQRKTQANELAGRIERLEAQPTTQQLRERVELHALRLDAVRPEGTATRLRGIAEALERAGLTDRSISAGDPYRRDGMVLTDATFAFRGPLGSVSEALRSPSLNTPGVLVRRVRVAPGSVDDPAGLAVELDLVLARPE